MDDETLKDHFGQDSWSDMEEHIRKAAYLKPPLKTHLIAVSPEALGLIYDDDRGRFTPQRKTRVMSATENEKAEVLFSMEFPENDHTVPATLPGEASVGQPSPVAAAKPPQLPGPIETAVKTAETTAVEARTKLYVEAPNGGAELQAHLKEALEKLPLSALISRRNLWWAGIICASVAAVAGGFGDCVLRRSFVIEGVEGYADIGEADDSATDAVGERRRERSRTERPLCRRPLWLLGMFLTMVLNPVLTLVAFRFTAMSIVSMFGGLHILTSLLFAEVFLNEGLQWQDVMGGVLIIAGTVTVVTFGHAGSPAERFTVDTIAFCIFCPGCLFAIALSILISFQVPPFKRIPPVAVTVCTALVPGIAGALSNLCGKGAVILWTDALQDPTFWRSPYTWIFAIGAALAAAVQIVFLSVGLSKYPASFVSPVYNAILLCFNSIGGIWIYAEYARHLPYYLLGLTSLLAGIWTTSRGQEMRMVFLHCTAGQNLLIQFQAPEQKHVADAVRGKQLYFLDKYKQYIPDIANYNGDKEANIPCTL